MSREKAYRWIQNNCPQQWGRKIVITGGASGIGEALVGHFVELGANVIIGDSNVKKGEEVAKRHGDRAQFRPLDLSSLQSVREFAKSIEYPLDILINNAGTMGGIRSLTRDGFEKHFGINHLGPFALTLLLAPIITDRVVMTTSQAHREANFDLFDVNSKNNYDPLKVYGKSKVANLLFMAELNRKARSAALPLKAMAAHPGVSKSNLLSSTATDAMLRFIFKSQNLFGQSSDMGALPILYVATCDVPSGSYGAPSGFYELRGYPKLSRPSGHACDLDLAAKLWNLSEDLTGIEWQH